ncbi:MAG: GatB/YqeY domain-containing protein [Candidatus Moranbacteria bacterium]|nr:GatB/YqeY domain-containing protein [Candidatus Moranbacteria bacterium]
MANLKTAIDQALIKSLKQKDATQAGVLRMLKSAIKEKEIAKKNDLLDNEIIPIVRSQIKSRQESRKQFQQAGRDQLAQKETQEIEVLKKFLPKQLTEQELIQKIQPIIDKVQAKSPQDLGKVMPLVIKEAQGQADNQAIKNTVLKLLK